MFLMLYLSLQINFPNLDLLTPNPEAQVSDFEFAT